jgi:hypothetical protein
LVSSRKVKQFIQHYILYFDFFRHTENYVSVELREDMFKKKYAHKFKNKASYILQAGFELILIHSLPLTLLLAYLSTLPLLPAQ